MFEVKIKNFQSVSDIAFNVEGFTVIVGRNNLGKSAIIRAIEAALVNRPGSEFIRWGKTETEVELKRDDLHIEWKKGDKSVYKVNNHPYSALGKGTAPQPVLNAGFRKIEIGDKKKNPLIVNQFDELFLLNESGSAVTNVLSDLYNINVINDADDLCQKYLRTTKGLLKTRETDLSNINDQLDKFKGFEDLQKENEKLKKLYARAGILEKEFLEINEYEKQYEKLSVLCEILSTEKIKIPSINKIEKEIADYQWIKDFCLQLQRTIEAVQQLKPVFDLKIPDIKKVSGLFTDLKILTDLCDEFKKSLEMVQQLKPVSLLNIPATHKIPELINELKTISELHDQFKLVVLSFERCKSIMPDLKIVDKINADLKDVEQKVSDFSFINSVQDTFFTTARTVKNLQAEIKKTDEEWSKWKEEYNKFKLCPLCKNPVTSL